VKEQEDDDGENYTELKTFKTKYPRYLEFMVHEYLKTNRVLLTV
jgi:hypothetical protein